MPLGARATFPAATLISLHFGLADVLLCSGDEVVVAEGRGQGRHEVEGEPCKDGNRVCR